MTLDTADQDIYPWTVSLFSLSWLCFFLHDLLSGRIFQQVKKRGAHHHPPPTPILAASQYPRKENFSLLTFPEIVQWLWLYCPDLSRIPIPEYFSGSGIYLNEPGFSCPDQFEVVMIIGSSRGMRNLPGEGTPGQRDFQYPYLSTCEKCCNRAQKTLPLECKAKKPLQRTITTGLMCGSGSWNSFCRMLRAPLFFGGRVPRLQNLCLSVATLQDLWIFHFVCGGAFHTQADLPLA